MLELADGLALVDTGFGAEDVREPARRLGPVRHLLSPVLDEAEIAAMIDAAIDESGAETMRDMGKVMARLKPQMQGRADLGAVSALVKQRLG